MSTFHGLEMAKRALYAQQSALYTTGHNISNANTEGYTRQRVNFETLTAYPSGSRNRPQIPGQIGQGAQAGSVERIRDSFLDLQFRAENSKTGYWETMSSSLYRMESLLNEPSESGLANTMDKFWQSLQDLSVNPENSGARSVVTERGLAVADTFNYLRQNLQKMQDDTSNQIDVTIKDANSLLSQINRINNQIKEIEPHGYLANDLYDERDRLIDELSSIVNIKVHRVESSESALDIAGGLTKIELINDNGTSYSPEITLLSPGEEPNYLEIDPATNTVTIGDTTNVVLPSGSLKALIDVHGGTPQEDIVSYGLLIQELDKMAETLTAKFNEQHNNGRDLNNQAGLDFFQYTNGVMTVNNDIVKDPKLLAASADGTAGNGDNALKLAEVFDTSFSDNPAIGNGTSVKSFYEGLIGSLGVSAQEANRMADNTAVLRSQVEEQRMSVSSVSLDEEMTNMIKFQHAYNAAARSMTAMDEILDRIINNMGLVGR
ncbi:flagellar hook-associated protein FlgK [Ornithinibacillus scapharcae]|uniref:flagellar hook-associated protein FlgK n=1 Tax=Ornithinibacillus scapharcae TaxID=1147159 RepID=UPI000225B3D8|nr:flagellar hook-associated protein FlgK [Ornithinibacillus scapharcae]